MNCATVGHRKLIVVLVAILALWVGAMARVIPGDVASWSIVAVVSVAVTGYTGEHWVLGPKRRVEKEVDSDANK